jgi:isopentenyl diphosphate isomerase/L-lactate dehydrogenase-like FMN-dependent dehydrogenase
MWFFKGEEGVFKVLQIFKDEFKLAMGLSGKYSLTKISYIHITIYFVIIAKTFSSQ